MDTNDRLIRAVQLATRKLASSGNFDLLIKDVLAICVEAVGATGGSIYLHDAAGNRLRFQHVLPEDVADKLPSKDIPDDFGMAGLAFQSRQTQVKSWPPKPDSERNAFEMATGVTLLNMVATPLAMEDETPLGVVQLINKKDGSFNEFDCAVLDTVSAVATMAYLNYRLTEESTRASSLLGMGKVSHDIGNLAASLYASLSFSGMAMDGLRSHLEDGDPDVTTKEYLDELSPMFGELKNSVDRIVGYSRLISDMSAGRQLRPNLTVGSMASTIRTSSSYLATEARANHVALQYEIDDEAPDALFDELYLFRIVQNLVGNSIKAVKETIPDDWLRAHSNEIDDPETYGEVTVRYFFADSMHTLEVCDTGPGMTREVAEKILSGNARSQWDKGGGSGWGTKIVLELATTLSAKVSIESEIGKGSTFRVEIPHQTD